MCVCIFRPYLEAKTRENSMFNTNIAILPKKSIKTCVTGRSCKVLYSYGSVCECVCVQHNFKVGYSTFSCICVCVQLCIFVCGKHFRFCLHSCHFCIFIHRGIIYRGLYSFCYFVFGPAMVTKERHPFKAALRTSKSVYIFRS